MAVAQGQLCLRKFTPGNVIEIWDKTGVGDWLRTRFTTSQVGSNSNTSDNTFYAVLDVYRGLCYAGSTKLATQSDANSGWTTGGTWGTYTYKDSGTTTHYRQFNVASAGCTPTKCRVGFLTVSTSERSLLLNWYNAGNVLLRSDSISVYNATTFVTTGAWVDVPAGASYVKVQPDANNTHYFAYLQWVGTTTSVEPDAGGLMYSGQYELVVDGDLGIAAYHNTVGQAFNSDRGFGGIASHLGINTCTTAWKYQVGTNDIAAWDGATTTVCDFVRLETSAGSVYLEKTCLTKVATISDSSTVLSAGGEFRGKMNVAYDPGVTITVFGTYLAQMRSNGGVASGGPNRVFFAGDSQAREFPAGGYNSTVKTLGLRLWGGSNRMVYTIEFRNPEYVNYFRNTTSVTGYPCVTSDGKVYWRRIHYAAVSGGDASINYSGDAGDKHQTDYTLRLSDKSLVTPTSSKKEV